MCNVIHGYENKIVAVMGARGYLASVLVDALRKTPAHILRISRRDLLPVPGTEAIKADVRKRECWEEIVSRADVIFHLAGNTSVRAAAKDPAESLNSTVLPIAHLVAAAEAAGRKPRVIYASTATIYGLTVNLPVGEDAEPRPVTNYDLHKLFAERQLDLASKRGIVEGVSLRLANVYGPSTGAQSADDRGILNRITLLALQGVNLQLYGDGAYLRDYVHIDDVVRAFIVSGLEKGVVGRSFNVATGKGITLRDAFHLVVERVERASGRKVYIENSPWPDGADPIESRNFTADIASFQKAAGWYPLISLDQGVDGMIKHFSENNEARA